MQAHSPHRKAKPVTPHRPHPAPGRHASPSQHQPKSGLLGALSNMAGQSGGSPPGQQQDQQAPPWASDPILAQIQSLQQSNIAAAEGQAAAARSQALINFGYDPGMPSLYADQQTAGSAKANPYSVLSQLSHNHELRQRGMNENLNKENLFYSGYRGQQLGEEGRTYIGEQAGARSNLMSALGGISENLLGAKQNAQGAITQGSQDAYTRWLNQQLQYGLGNPGGAAGHTAHPAAHPPHPRRSALRPAHHPQRPPRGI